MNPTVQATLLAFVMLTAVLVLRLIRNRRLRGKYVLLWLGACAAMAPLAVVPDRVDRAVADLGVSYPPSAYLLVGVVFLFAVAVHMSWELSRLDDRTRTLAEELALLRGEVETSRPAVPPTTDLEGSSPHAT